jgi:hypothetical protein
VFAEASKPSKPLSGCSSRDSPKASDRMRHSGGAGVGSRVSELETRLASERWVLGLHCLVGSVAEFRREDWTA